MKKLIFALVLMLSSTANAGGDVYFGTYKASNYTVSPFASMEASFVSGVYLEKELKVGTPALEYVKPWLRLETFMDSYNGNFSFHPAAIKYDVGVTVGLYKGTYVDVSRMCWHPVDSGGRVAQYFLFKVGYKW